MQSKQIENTIVDEVTGARRSSWHQEFSRTVRFYRAIRREILQRGRILPTAGETLIINLMPSEAASWLQPITGPAQALSLPEGST
jgi:hypothetical protein